MTTNENVSSPTKPNDFAIVMDNWQKLDLLEIEREILDSSPKIHVVDESEYRYGEPGTLILIALVGSLALPPILLWLATYNKGFKVQEQKEMTLPDGSTVKYSLKISMTESAPPSADQLRELAKLGGIDPTKILDKFFANASDSGESS